MPVKRARGTRKNNSHASEPVNQASLGVFSGTCSEKCAFLTGVSSKALDRFSVEKGSSSANSEGPKSRLLASNMGASKVLVDDSERLSVVAFKKSETPVAEKTQDSEDNLPTITLRSVLVGLTISAFGATCAQVSAFQGL